MRSVATTAAPRNQGNSNFDLDDLQRIFDVTADPPLTPRRTIPATTGELALLREILADAVRIIGGALGGSGKLHRPIIVHEALRWVALGNVGRIPFDQCCDAIGVDPVRTRRALLSSRSEAA